MCCDTYMKPPPSDVSADRFGGVTTTMLYYYINTCTHQQLSSLTFKCLPHNSPHNSMHQIPPINWISLINNIHEYKRATLPDF